MQVSKDQHGQRAYPATTWLVQLLRRRPVAIPWMRALRAVLALALPLAIGFGLDHPELGVLTSTGALPVVLADRGGPYRQRAFRLSATAVAATTGYGVGLLTTGAPVISAFVLVLLAALSVLISAAGDNASQAALLMLVFGVVGAGQYMEGVSTLAFFGFFVLGMAWSVAVALAAWVVRGTSAERASVAQVFVELAVLLSVQDAATSRAARHQLTTAMNTAYDQLLTARARMARRDAAYRRLLTLLSQATPIVEAAVAMLNTGQRAPRAVVDHVMDVAAAVYADNELPEHPATPEGPSSSAAVSALYAGLARLGQGGERAPNPPASLRTWFRDLVTSLTPDRRSARAVVRLTLCVAIAESVSLVLPLDRAHWIPLTVAIVLKPELGSVFGRAVLRGIGTVAGIGLSAGVLLVYPQGWLLVVLGALFAGGVAIGKAMNYGLLSACVTPLIIIQMDIQNLGEPMLLVERLAHSLLGCVIVLIFGYWLWPGTMRPNAGKGVADTVNSVRHYVDIGLHHATPDADRITRRRARRKAYRALADLRSALSQVLVEPSAAGRQAIVLWSATVALERVVDAVTHVCVTAEYGGDGPAQGDIDRLTDALDELATAVRTGRDPQRMPMPESEVVATVARHVDAVFDTISGIESDTR